MGAAARSRGAWRRPRAPPGVRAAASRSCRCRCSSAASSGLRSARVAGAAAAEAPVPCRHRATCPRSGTTGALRLLVTAPEHLQRAGDPKRDGAGAGASPSRGSSSSAAIPVVVSDRSQLIPALRAGRGDVIVGSLAVTPERAAGDRLHPARPLRGAAGGGAEGGPEHAAGRRPGREDRDRPSPRAPTPPPSPGSASRVKGLEIKPARETEDTFDLIQKVARGEEAITVADSDILDAALTFEPRVKAAFALTERDPIAWGIRKENPALKAALDAFLVERALTGSKERSTRADLDAIRKRGALRVLTRNSSTTYFLHRGEELGFEYELAREFARTLGVRLELVIPPSREALATYLREGKGDLIAAGLAVTAERGREFAFTAPYNRVSELLVVPDQGPDDPEPGRPPGPEDRRAALVELPPGARAPPGPARVRAGGGRRGRGDGGHPGGRRGGQVRRDGGRLEHRRRRADLQRRDPQRRARSATPATSPGCSGRTSRSSRPRPTASSGRIYRSTRLQHDGDEVLQEPAADARGGQRGPLGQGRPALALRPAGQEVRDDVRVRLAARHGADVPGVALRPGRPELGRGAGADAGDAADGQGGERRGRAEARAGDPRGREGARRAMSRCTRSRRSTSRTVFASRSPRTTAGPATWPTAAAWPPTSSSIPNRWFGHVEKAMPLLAKPRFARTARHGYCRCSEPVKYVSEIQSRYESYSKLIALH